MLNALQPVFSKLPPQNSILDIVLPKITKLLQDEFIYWIDGGAGVGTTSAAYAAILDQELDEEYKSESIVACYDPLPENVAVLRERFENTPRFLIREVALSNSCGEATFSIPTRITSAGAGPWAPGTSYSGSLKHAAADRERITVKTVRLADEDIITRFDFVKLDLQGGELDALKGMDGRLREAKLLYIETQLLHDWGTLPFLSANGFALFFDRLQFGFRDGLTYLPFEALEKCGISIDRMHLPQSSGMPLICWGHFDSSVGMIDPQTFVLRPLLAKMLLDAGVNYLQTDTICVNLNYLPRIIPLLLPSG